MDGRDVRARIAHGDEIGIPAKEPTRAARAERRQWKHAVHASAQTRQVVRSKSATSTDRRRRSCAFI
eukprot:6174128-Pleurochrysis_carterae.AAC.1